MATRKAADICNEEENVKKRPRISGNAVNDAIVSAAAEDAVLASFVLLNKDCLKLC